MRKLRLIGGAGLALAALAMPVAGADAKQTKSACPKKWAPVPLQAAPDRADRDRNGNFVVCAKSVDNQGNPHVNVKDDRTDQPVLPLFWSTALLDETDPYQDVFFVHNLLDFPGHYYLDPQPDQFDDDVEVP